MNTTCYRYLLLLLACLWGIGGCGDKNSPSRKSQDIIPPEADIRAALIGEDIFGKAEGAYLAGKYRYHDLVPLLRKNARDKSWYVRYNSLSALLKLKNTESLPLFLECIQDRNSSVRFKSLEALAEIGDRTSLPIIISKLNDKSIYVRAAAAYSLGKLKMLKAVPPLIDHLSPREEEMVRFEAHLALTRITGQDFPAQQDLWQKWWGASATMKAVPTP